MARPFIIPSVPSTEFDTTVVFTEQDRKVMPFGFLPTFREMGWRNYRRACYEAATRNFNIAMGLFPDDRRTVIGRGFSRSKNMLFEGALQDAEAVLMKNEFDKEAIYLQALSQYELGNFEKGLVAFYKGINKRGNRPEFRDGRYQAEGTIDDCIGRYSGPMLTDMKPIIKKMKEKERREKLKSKVRKCVDDLDLPQTRPCSDYEWHRYIRQQEQLKSVLAETYLGKLNSDRKWLGQVLQNPNLRSANKEGTEKLISLAQKALDDINKRQEILNSRCPYYHMRYKVEFSGNGYKKQKLKMDNEKASVLKVVTINLLSNIKKQRLLKNTKNCIELVQRTKVHLDKAPKRLLPEKKHFLEILYNLAGLVYLDIKKYKPDLTDRLNYKRIVCMLGFDPIFNDEKVDTIIQESPFPYANYDLMLKNCEYCLEVATTNLERAWLYHEIARCFGEQRKWEYMVNRAKKCVNAAKQCDSLVWIINGLFMMVIGEVREKSKDESMETLKECLSYAYRYEDESVIKFLLTCNKVLKEKDTEEILLDVNSLLKKKEEYTVNLISDVNLKEQAKDLFRRMEILSAKRRFSIAPGFIPTDPPGFSSARLSIIAGGSGGRLSLHPYGKTTYKEFLEIYHS